MRPTRDASSSQFGELMDGAAVTARKTGRVLEALIVSVILFGAGAATGWWVRDNIAKNDKAIERADHLAEIERLNANYTTALNYMSGKVTATAVIATQAADNAHATISAAGVAVEKAGVAADEARAAASKAASVARKVDAVPEPTRAQINRAVGKANEAAQK